MSFIIHIGPHKSGSTYLQKALYDNSDILLNNSISYPNNEVWLKQFGHHKIANKSPNLNLILLDEIAEYSDKCRLNGITTLISSEEFDRWSLDDVNELYNRINDEIHIVYFYRRSPSFFYSIWQEKVKHGFYQTFSDFLLNEIVNPKYSKLINQSLILDNWFHASDKVKLSIIDYDYITSYKKDIIQIFTNLILGIDIVGDGASINKALTIENSELLRALNLLHKESGRSDFLKFRSAFLKIIDNYPCAEYLYDAIKMHIKEINLTSQYELWNHIYMAFDDKYSRYFITNKHVGHFDGMVIKMPNMSWQMKNNKIINSLYNDIIFSY
jgi:hypothetical protein